jgi:Putative peptidoglycan binding domain/N-acetylmuramoyl-L-alanine amidase
MVHHTGSDNASAAPISPARFRSCTSRGTARSPWSRSVSPGTPVSACIRLPTNMGNWHMIGIECANSGTSPTASHRTNWPDAQYFALVRCCAAISRRLAQNSSRTIGHKEYAGRAQGKWDPGAIAMDVLRGDIQARIGSIANPAPTPRPPVPVGQYADVLLLRGSEGPQVTQLQRRLEYAYDDYAGELVIDGYFGPETEAAVKEFQRRTPGLKVDGTGGRRGLDAISEPQ